MNEQNNKLKQRGAVLTKKEKFVELLRTAVMMLVSTALFAFAAYCLIEPNKFTIGGVSGIAIMLSHVSNGAIPQSAVILGLNLPLVILSFFFVKKKFAILTCVHTALQSLWLFLLETLNVPEIVFDDGTKIFAAVAAALCLGTALAIIFKLGGSSGGGDIIAVIIGSSFFVFYDAEQTLALNLLPIMMSLFELYIESKTNDSITNGFQSAIEFRIITDKAEEMAETLMAELDRGVTAIPAKGMYTGQEHTMVVCVIGKKQVTALRKIMNKVDPEAYAVMSNVSQVVGLGFYSSNND